MPLTNYDIFGKTLHLSVSDFSTIKRKRHTHKLAYSRGLKKHELLFLRHSPCFQNPLGDFSNHHSKCKPSVGKVGTGK